MSRQGLSKIFGRFESFTQKHTPEILTGIGVAGMITATVLAVKATPKAMRLIEEKKQEENTDKLSAAETVKTAWVCYIPAAITIAVSAVCVIGAASVNSKRNAALAAAYTLSESARKGYGEKVVEMLGEKKDKEVKDAVAKDEIDKNPVRPNEVVITEHGGTLCYDVISGRYFKSDIESLKKAANDINVKMLNENYISLNEFYYEIGLSDIGIGNDIGWNIINGELVELYFSSQLTEDGTPCVVVGHVNAPRYGYQWEHA